MAALDDLRGQPPCRGIVQQAQEDLGDRASFQRLAGGDAPAAGSL